MTCPKNLQQSLAYHRSRLCQTIFNLSLSSLAPIQGPSRHLTEDTRIRRDRPSKRGKPYCEECLGSLESLRTTIVFGMKLDSATKYTTATFPYFAGIKRKK